MKPYILSVICVALACVCGFALGFFVREAPKAYCVEKPPPEDCTEEIKKYTTITTDLRICEENLSKWQAHGCQRCTHIPDNEICCHYGDQISMETRIKEAAKILETKN